MNNTNKTLGLAVITKNEEKNIQQCLESVPFAICKIVVDSMSTDRTVEIAKKHGAEVIVREWPGYPKQKQFALEQVKADWILVLDADEFLTLEAQEEIKNIIQNPNSFDAYRIPRYQFFMGKLLKHGKGVDAPLRLIRNGKGIYTEREVHEEILVKGHIGALKHGMKHESSVDIMARYEKIKRDMLLEKQYTSNVQISRFTLFGGPIRYFLSYFFKSQTWRDGTPGVIWLLLFTIQIFLQQAIQYEHNVKNQ